MDSTELARLEAQVIGEAPMFEVFFTADRIENYRDILTFTGNQPFARYLTNSVIVLTLTLAGGMLFNSMAAFVLAWGRLPGRPSRFRIPPTR